MKDLRIGKYKVDIFFVIALVAGVVLLFTLPDRKQDIVAYLVVVVGFLGIDVWINGKDGGEDE